MPEAPSKPATKLLMRPRDQVSVLTFVITFTLRTLMTCFHFLENIFYFKGKNLQNRELRADTGDHPRNDQKIVLCQWLPSLQIPHSQDWGAAHLSPQKTEGYSNAFVSSQVPPPRVQFPLLFVHFYRQSWIAKQSHHGQRRDGV